MQGAPASRPCPPPGSCRRHLDDVEADARAMIGTCERTSSPREGGARRGGGGARRRPCRRAEEPTRSQRRPRDDLGGRLSITPRIIGFRGVAVREEALLAGDAHLPDPGELGPIADRGEGRVVFRAGQRSISGSIAVFSSPSQGRLAALRQAIATLYFAPSRDSSSVRRLLERQSLDFPTPAVRSCTPRGVVESARATDQLHGFFRFPSQRERPHAVRKLEPARASNPGRSFCPSCMNVTPQDLQPRFRGSSRRAASHSGRIPGENPRSADVTELKCASALARRRWANRTPVPVGVEIASSTRRGSALRGALEIGRGKARARSAPARRATLAAVP